MKKFFYIAVFSLVALLLSISVVEFCFLLPKIQEGRLERELKRIIEHDYSKMTWQEIDKWFGRRGYKTVLGFDQDQDKTFGRFMIGAFPWQGQTEEEKELVISFYNREHEALPQEDNSFIYNTICKLYSEPDELLIYDRMKSEFDDIPSTYGYNLLTLAPGFFIKQKIYCWQLKDRYIQFKDYDGWCQLSVSYKPYGDTFKGTLLERVQLSSKGSIEKELKRLVEHDYSKMTWQEMDKWLDETGYEYINPAYYDMEKDKQIQNVLFGGFPVQGETEFDLKFIVLFQVKNSNGGHSELPQDAKQEIVSTMCKLYSEPEKLVFPECDKEPVEVSKQPVVVFGKEVLYWNVGDKHLYLQDYNGFLQLRISYKPYLQ